MGTRSDQARQAVVDATLALVAEGGVDRLTIEAVAQRSGVAKTTIYRHWPSKVDLVVAAVRDNLPTLPTPNTGDVRTDVAACLRSLRDLFRQSEAPRIMCSLLSASWLDPELEHLQDRLNEQRDRPLHTVVELAQLRGQLPAHLDVDQVSSMLLGPLVSRSLLLQQEVGDEFLDLVADTVLDGLGVERVVAPT